ncbi:Hypothetical Protein KQS_08460 [Flavobacterium indicum GPTSA100-9 = DSM 17447]|uniref:Zinc-finger domain-containing protein n=2 Tax=Flavobacterium TaxID=237 RepID=H8XTP9_FLAIG|nr:Hypothetical Protein KQS_08460 [Flavobacterium indicum GPTSA100-9 = DSM 17447]
MIVQKLMNILVNSCKRTTELIDKQSIVPLSIKEKMQLQMHKSMCKTCNAYEHQSKFIDKIITNWFNKDSSSKKVKLSNEKKVKIIEEINKL